MVGINKLLEIADWLITEIKTAPAVILGKHSIKHILESEETLLT